VAGACNLRPGIGGIDEVAPFIAFDQWFAKRHGINEALTAGF
jgi:hypothetical protein